MLSVRVEENSIRIGERFIVSFQRTLRVPDDGKTYPLPPGLGEFPIHRVDDYIGHVPADWLDRGGVFIPLYQREALWLGFEAAYWKPKAVKVRLGNINAITGGNWEKTLKSDPQDYLVCPPQPWLDGIKTGSGVVRQFVATPLGLEDSIEAQLTGDEIGGLQIHVFEPRAGIFPDEPPPRMLPTVFQTESVASSMAVAAGGEIQQKIYPDPHGLDTWDFENSGSVWVHILNSRLYKEVTGLKPPPTPVDARIYTQHGFPWFEIYDEKIGDLTPTQRLTEVQTLRERQAERGMLHDATNEPIEIPSQQVHRVRSSNAGHLENNKNSS
jgi:hypothetical protein